MKMQPYTTVNEYLANFSGETSNKLKELRKTIQKVMPTDATEKISYGIPTFYLKSNLIHFAGYKGHVALYPGSVPIEEFKDKLTGYKTSKGTVQFPLDKPLPLDLIQQIAMLCVERRNVKNGQK